MANLNMNRWLYLRGIIYFKPQPFIHFFHLLRCLNPGLLMLNPAVISQTKAAFPSSSLLNPPFNDSFPSVVAFNHSTAFYHRSLAAHPDPTASSRSARSNYMTLSTLAGAHAIPTIYGCLSISTAVYNVEEYLWDELWKCTLQIKTGQTIPMDDDEHFSLHPRYLNW